MNLHLAEMLLDIKYRGAPDKFRKRHPFSEDIESTHAILFNPSYDKRKKIRAYREWLGRNQPCVFGMRAAKTKNVFICLLEEHEILRMRNGDHDLRDTLQDYRQVWKRYAFEGLSSSLIILLVSKSLIDKEPQDRLKEICRRFLELYMGIDKIADDTVLPEREYVFLRTINSGGNSKIIKFSTLPNIFCAQGDGRWWHDHRTPGGMMITSNALGHFTYCITKDYPLQDKDKLLALEHAMRTISNAYHGPITKKASKLRHCPATYLIPLAEGETSPLRSSSDFTKYSSDHYCGYIHTDYLIPSVFFKPERDPKKLKLYDNLSFRYIFDTKDEDHEELMTGGRAKWYEITKDMDRLPDFVNPERVSNFSEDLRGRLARWLDDRLKKRLEP